MATLVYSPGIQVLVSTANHGTIDLSDDIISGSVTLNVNSEHQLRLMMENSRRKYDGVFMPNDRVVLRLKRLRWLQVMSGYLDRVPMASTWPAKVTLHASCTLKRVKYTLFDRGAPESVSLLTTTHAEAESPDGGMAKVVTDLLTNVGQWPSRSIHIAKLPEGWSSSISALYHKVSPEFDNLSQEAIDWMPPSMNGQGVIGGEVQPNISGNAVVGGTIDNPSIAGPSSVSPQHIIKWYRDSNRPEPVGVSLERLAMTYVQMGASEGIRGDLAFIQAVHETGNFQSTGARRDNNYAGIAHQDGQKSGRKFASPAEGVRAHIQLLKKVTAGNDVTLALPDSNVNWHGKPGTHLIHLTRNWAPDPRYHQSLSSLYQKLLAHAGVTELGSLQNSSAAGLESTNKFDWSSLFGGSSSTAGGKPVFPVAGKTVADIGSGFGRRLHPISKTWRHHNGVDISGPHGTPVLATVNGTITRARNNIKGDNEGNNGNGNDIIIREPSGTTHHYLHLQFNSLKVSEGQTVTAGQHIAGIGSTGSSTGPHLHYEYRPGGTAVNPKPFLEGTVSAEGFEGSAGTMGMGDGMMPMPIMMPSEDVQSAILTGVRAYMNDSSLLQTVSELISSSQRDFCSAPNGDFIAWFPDYFNNFDILGSIILEDIELMDFTMDWDDRAMVTHQFVTGSRMSMGAGGFSLLDDISSHGIVSVDFPEVIEALLGEVPEGWGDSNEILQRFGARKNHQRMSAFLPPDSEFFLAVHLFLKSWATQFSTSLPISFMPELWPGMHLKVPSQGVQVYVDQVTHSWNMADGGGFTTQASVIAPASLDGRHRFLPKVGSLKNVAAENRPPAGDP